jgi:hypothetical protein
MSFKAVKQQEVLANVIILQQAKAVAITEEAAEFMGIVPVN